MLKYLISPILFGERINDLKLLFSWDICGKMNKIGRF